MWDELYREKDWEYKLSQTPKASKPSRYPDLDWIEPGQLREGMTTYVSNNRGGWVPDVKLGTPFLTSPRFPEIAFRTVAGSIVKFHPCGKVPVTR